MLNEKDLNSLSREELLKLLEEQRASKWLLEFKMLIMAEKAEREIEEQEKKREQSGFWAWKHYKCSCKGKRCKPVCLCSKPSNRCDCKRWVARRKSDPPLEVQAPPTKAVFGKRVVYIA